MTEPIFTIGMQVIELDIYGFVIKDKGKPRTRIIISDELRKQAILKDADVDRKYAGLDYVALSICEKNHKMFITLEEAKIHKP